jgi:RNA polymerase sigma-70 factor (ECF subfamily)
MLALRIDAGKSQRKLLELVLSAVASEKQEQIAKDVALAARIAQRDQHAFRVLYRDYAPKLLRRLLDILNGNESLAEDCLQVVFMKCYQKIGEYRGEGTLLSWLHCITTNVVMDRFRSQQRWFVALRSMLSEQHTKPKHSHAIPEKLFLRKEAQGLVHECLEQLDYRKRMAILLCDFEGLKIEEAASEMDVSMGTIGSRLHNGRKELRKRLLREGTKRGLEMEDWLNG